MFNISKFVISSCKKFRKRRLRSIRSNLIPFPFVYHQLLENLEMGQHFHFQWKEMNLPLIQDSILAFSIEIEMNMGGIKKLIRDDGEWEEEGPKF